MGLQVSNQRRKYVPRVGRVVAVFGIPYTGKTSILKAIQENSKKIVGVISTGDIARSLITEEDKKAMAGGGLFPREQEMRDTILERIELFRSRSADIIFLDGCPRMGDQVKWLWEQKLVGGSNGKVIKLEASNPAIIRRSKVREKRSDDDIASFRDRIQFQRDKFPEIDQMINALGLQRDYFTINNEDGVDKMTLAASAIVKISDLEEGYTRGEI